MHTAHLVGGPRNGETHKVELAGVWLKFPGPVEERRLVGWDDGPRYSYPTDVYAQDCSFGPVPNSTTYRYAGRIPA